MFNEVSMRTIASVLIFLFSITLLSCDSVDNKDRAISNITEREAWLSEALAWQDESLAFQRVSQSYDSLSVLFDRDGYDSEYWDSFSSITSDIDDAISLTSNLAKSFSDSSDYYSLQSNIARIFADNTLCLPLPLTRSRNANKRKDNLGTLATEIADIQWLPDRDNILSDFQDALYSWALSANNWIDLHTANFLTDWDSITDGTCTAQTLVDAGLLSKIAGGESTP